MCQATGDPKPRVTWNKKGKKVNSQRFEVSWVEGRQPGASAPQSRSSSVTEDAAGTFPRHNVGSQGPLPPTPCHATLPTPAAPRLPCEGPASPARSAAFMSCGLKQGPVFSEFYLALHRLTPNTGAHRRASAHVRTTRCASVRIPHTFPCWSHRLPVLVTYPHTHGTLLVHTQAQFSAASAYAWDRVCIAPQCFSLDPWGPSLALTFFPCPRQTIEFDGSAGAVLRIQPLRTPRDENVYECVAQNSVGEITVHAKLTVLRGTGFPPCGGGGNGALSALGTNTRGIRESLTLDLFGKFLFGRPQSAFSSP